MKKIAITFMLLIVAQVTVFAQCTPALFKNDFSPYYMAVANGSLFTLADGIWKSDGTIAGTMKINSSPNTTTTDYKAFAVHGSEIYFSAYYNTGRGLWKTDGTEAGTVMIKGFPDAEKIIEITPAGNKVFFLLDGKEFASGDLKLWVTDGTEAGTMLVKDLDPSNSNILTPQNLFAYNNEIYFWAGNNTNYNKQFWKSNGTDAGTVVVNDIGNEYGYFSSAGYAVLNNELYYYTGSNTSNNGLWKTNGTATGTKLVKECYAIKNLTNINGVLYFSAYDPAANTGQSQYGEEIWKSDGTSGGTNMIKDIRPGSSGSIYHLNAFKELNGKVLFAATDGTTGHELWITDGTEAGTQLVKDIKSGSASSGTFLGSAVVFNGTLYFSADDGSNGTELWKTDGTAAGTIMVADLYSGSEGSSPNKFTLFNGDMFFTIRKDFKYSLWHCGSSSGINELTKNTIRLFPNPSNGQFIITSDIMQGGVIEVYNVLGMKVYSEMVSSLSSNDIDISHCSKGVFLVKIITAGSEARMKLILE